jgi:hypothetical protein
MVGQPASVRFERIVDASREGIGVRIIDRSGNASACRRSLDRRRCSELQRVRDLRIRTLALRCPASLSGETLLDRSGNIDDDHSAQDAGSDTNKGALVHGKYSTKVMNPLPSWQADESLDRLSFHPVEHGFRISVAVDVIRISVAVDVIGHCRRQDIE